MLPDLPPAAEGELGQTPFAHLVAYALDKRIGGEIFLLGPTDSASEASPDTVSTVIRFENGVPTKIRSCDEFALLGALLLERGLVEPSMLEGALATRAGLLGDMLVLGGCVEPKALDETLAHQLEQRMVRCFSFPSNARFKYFDKADTLAHWGGDPLAPNPFRLLWLGIEAHGALAATMAPTLEQLGDIVLQVHARAPYHRFGFEGPAADVMDVLAMEPLPYPELLKLETAPPELVQKIVYTLLLCRQLDGGKGALPIGVEERPANVAKMQLRSTQRRLGVAIDEPGEGERTPVRPISIRRGTSGKFEIIPREEDLARRVDPPADDLSRPVASSPEPKPETKPAPESTPAPEPKPEDREEPSQTRFIADALRAMPVKALTDLAIERIDEKDAKGALEVCAVLRAKSESSPTELADAKALTIWASSLKQGADIKVYVLELDDSIEESDRAPARFVRGLLRKRLSEDKGALADFKRAIELDSTWERATREATSLEKRIEKPAEKGLMKRLFGR